jgi:hypothetical protein
MRYIFSVLLGTIAAVVAILLHQTFPPVGIIVGLGLTVLIVWTVGRIYGHRRYKWSAAAAWCAVIFRGATFGTGQEVLMQGDGVGTSLLFIGIVLVLFTASRSRL